MIVSGIITDKSFGSNPYLPNIPVYVSDDKGKPTQPMVITRSDNNGKYSFSVDDNVKNISARLNSDTIITKSLSPFIDFDFSNNKVKELNEVVVVAPKKEVLNKPVNLESKPKIVKKEDLFLKYLPHGLLILGGLIISVILIRKAIK